MSVRVGIVQVNVTDLEQAWDFYVGILGMEGDWVFGRGHPFELAVGPPEGPTVLVYAVESMRRRNYPSETGVVLVFYTDNLDQTVRAWKAKNVEFIAIAWAEDDSGIAESPFGRFIAFADPFGNVHELLEAPSRPNGVIRSG